MDSAYGVCCEVNQPPQAHLILWAQEDTRGDGGRLDTRQAGGWVVWYTYMAGPRPLWLGAQRPNLASCGRLGGRAGP